MLISASAITPMRRIFGGGAGGFPAAEEIGIIYSKTLGDNLADWTVDGTSVSWTPNGTDLDVSGTKGTGGSGASNLFHDRLVLNTTDFDFTCLPKWKMRMNVVTGVSDGGSFGMGLGIQTTCTLEKNDTICRFGFDSGFNGDHVYYYNDADSAGISGQKVHSHPSLVNETEYWFEFERDGTTLTSRIYAANGTTVVSTSTEVENLINGSYILANTGQFAIHQFAGNTTVKSIEISSASMKNCDFAFIGDSITYGGKASSNANRWCEEYITLRGAGETFVDLGGWADRGEDVETRKEEIRAINPKNVFIAIGSNDEATGQWAGTGKQKIQDTADWITANTNATVYLLSPAARNGTNMGNVRDDLNLMGYTVIDIFEATKNPGDNNLQASYNSGDGIHLSDAGHDAVAAECNSIFPL